MAMTFDEVEAAARQLSAADRARLAENLLESLETEPSDDLPVPEWQLQIVEERIAEYRRNPSNVRSAYQIIHELRQGSR